jgi:hypothetical protein
MRNFTAAFAIVCGILFVYGFVVAGMRLSKIEGPREFTIVVSDTSADRSYSWLTVQGCVAEPSEDGVFCLPNGWFGHSGREWAGVQVPVPFRDAPKNVLLRFDAVVSDRQGKSQASATFLTVRGR